MGGNKNKKGGGKAKVFKVVGAKSLKKTKAKAVNLGLKNIKQKVQAMDKEFVEINKTPKPLPKSSPTVSKAKGKITQKSDVKKVSKEDVSKAADNIVKMDLESQ